MSEGINRYKADLRDIRFHLFEQFGLEDVLADERYAEWDADDVEMVLQEIYKWACDRLGPLNAIGDRQGCRLENGDVTTPDGFKEAWSELYEMGFTNLSAPAEQGGQGGPTSVAAAAAEMLMGANLSFMMYPGLTSGVCSVVSRFGTEEQKGRLVEKLGSGVFAGTMCLTESQAGSDVGANATKATKQEDGRYRIEGTKIYISAGNHDLSENIVHLVLARTPGAPAGTKGLSLFIVPRDHFDGSGSNHVVTASLEHKMGINGSATAVLNFGEGGDCYGELLGTEEERGIRQMFTMMNGARIEVGIQGLALASAAYLCALDYAKERKQGPSVKNWKDPEAPKVAIIEHPDVRRMLLDMKAKVEGIRALLFKLTDHEDRHLLASGRDDELAQYHRGQVDLLVPLVKAYGSDTAFEITATAIQVFGGAGYLKDWPVEQYCRDAKIASIYEGTNHIQALDLVVRKLGEKGGANFQAYLADIGKFVADYKDHATLGQSVSALATATESLGVAAMRFLGWFQAGDMEIVPLHASRFLAMMSETTVAWLLLHSAVVADDRKSELADGHVDHDFYDGKIAAARYYASEVLPNVGKNALVLNEGGRVALDIADSAFATV